MKSTKAKKTGPLEAARASRDLHATRSSAPTSRPAPKERTHSAPLVASNAREDRDDRQPREDHPATHGLHTNACIDLDNGHSRLHFSPDHIEPSENGQFPSTSGVVSWLAAMIRAL